MCYNEKRNEKVSVSRRSIHGAFVPFLNEGIFAAEKINRGKRYSSHIFIKMQYGRSAATGKGRLRFFTKKSIKSENFFVGSIYFLPEMV